LGKYKETNTLIVGTEEELGSRELIAEDVNWVSVQSPAQSFHAEVKSRYTSKEAPAEVTVLDGGGKVQVRFDEPQRDITTGQAAVFYDGDILLGGGIIR